MWHRWISKNKTSASLEYVIHFTTCSPALQLPRPSHSQVHFRLDLSRPDDHKMAVTLVKRAIEEPGETAFCFAFGYFAVLSLSRRCQARISTMSNWMERRLNSMKKKWEAIGLRKCTVRPCSIVLVLGTATIERLPAPCLQRASLSLITLPHHSHMSITIPWTWRTPP